MTETRLPNPPTTARMTDDVRIELLENAARTPGGVLLHASQHEDEIEGLAGLALDLKGRSLRDAIDFAFGSAPQPTLGAPHVVVTREALAAAVSNFVLAAKDGKITPEPRSLQSGHTEVVILEQFAQSWTDSLWSFLGGK